LSIASLLVPIVAMLLLSSLDDVSLDDIVRVVITANVVIGIVVVKATEAMQY
jgi:hypothetical protein